MVNCNKLMTATASALLMAVAIGCDDDETQPTSAGDTVPPSAVATLEVSSVGRTIVSLRWDAPGDDDDIGQATTYDVRYSDRTINESNWNSSAVLSEEPTPDVAGSGERFHVQELESGTTYFFALKAADEVPNWSGLSNVVSTTTKRNESPTAPLSPVPTSGAVDVPVDADLTWSTSVDPESSAVVYDVYFGSSETPPRVLHGVAGTLFDPGKLSYGTTYHWMVTAQDVDGGRSEGALWSFTTEVNEPPSAPTEPNPADGAMNAPLGMNLTWADSDDPEGSAVTYDVYLGTSTTPPLVAAALAAPLYDPEHLQHSRTYRWRVVAIDDGGRRTEGGLWAFSTIGNEPPSAPASPTPPDGSAASPVHQNLSWSTSNDPEGDDVTYDVFFGTTETPPLVLAEHEETFYDPGSLAHSTTYYWKVVAKDSGLAQSASSLWSFSTEGNAPPSAPRDPQPSDQATDLDTGTTLTWSPSIDPEAQEVRYDVYFAGSFPLPVVSLGQLATTFTPGLLSASTTYYWKVIAKDPRGNQAQGGPWRFETAPSDNILRVPSEFPTIQDAIHAASASDTVLVASGTYSGSSNRNLDFQGKDIVVLSEHGPEATVIDCQESGRAFVLDDGETWAATIEGFTITNGYVGGQDATGGAIYCDAASPTILNCVITANVSTLHGGGIGCRNGSEARIIDCLISDNAAEGGGAFYSNACAVSIVNCTITGNNGNGITCSDMVTPAIIEGCIIAGNTTASGLRGGGIRCEGGPAFIRGCVISENSANFGGGIHHTGSTELVIEDCLIAGNYASSWGGGIFCEYGGSPSIVGCTISGNRAGAGGGIRCGASGAGSIMIAEETIIWGNCATTGNQVYVGSASSSITFICSAVDSKGVDGIGHIEYSGQQVFADPLFCDARSCDQAPTSAGNYQLSDASPCLEAHSPCGESIGPYGAGCAPLP